MADAFREREQGEEAKYKLDEERHFKVLCRRNKLFAEWAAQQRRLDPVETAKYVRAMVTLLLEDSHADAVLERVIADFAAEGLPGRHAEAAQALARCQTAAAEQVAGDWHALGTDHVPIGG